MYPHHPGDEASHDGAGGLRYPGGVNSRTRGRGSFGRPVWASGPEKRLKDVTGRIVMAIPVVDTDFYEIEKRIERMVTYEEQQIIKNIKNFVAGKDVIETVKQCNIEGKPIPVKFMREMGQRSAQ